MDKYSSGEDLHIKTRKPYTITKQRERWTEEEHNRFLEALKLYGRAWQRIEEHIGTKTAVQIRSHAQKFFSKLEKEALVKGIPVGQAIDIDIPPPRPKRKPSIPYPRKNCAGNFQTTQIKAKDAFQGTSCSSPPAKQVLDLENKLLPEKSIVDGGGTEEFQDYHGSDLCSESTICQETSSTISPAANKSLRILKADAKDIFNFTACVPLAKNIATLNKFSKSDRTDGPRGSYNKSSGTVAMDVLQDDGAENEIQGAKNLPRHVPVQIHDGNVKACSQAFSSDVSYQEPVYPQMGVHAHPALFTRPTVSPTTDSSVSTSRPANHQKLPSFHPPFHLLSGTPEDYASLLQMSSTLSSLIVSTLVQNPAAHAAAIYAASFWPCTNIETSTGSHRGAVGGLPPTPVDPTTSMAAIAASTVAAATAWWGAHGLLPVCAPSYHASMTCPPAHTNCQPETVNKDTEENNIQNCSSPGQQLGQAFSKALKVQISVSKPPSTSESESGIHSGPKANNVIISGDHEKSCPEKTEQKDLSKDKNIKLVDRSSCGSNSSSDVGGDASEKHEQGKEETKEADADEAAGESSSRRSRTSSSCNESWKEVSNMGRMAFRALFLREILPQSFSPHPKIDAEDIKKKEEQNAKQSHEGTSHFDLNSNIMESCSGHHEKEKNRMAEHIEARERLLAIGLAQGKLKARRTGFKPYKRCSMEVRESRLPNTSSSPDEEKGPKRIRLGEEASS